MKTETLNALKKSVKVGDTLTLVDSYFKPHKSLGITRKIVKVQTNGIWVEKVPPQTQDSWLQWPKAVDYVAKTGGFSIMEGGKELLTYVVGG